MSTDKYNVDNVFKVKGLVAIVTGGGTGIGLMMATALENNGAIVYIASRRKEVLENAAKKHAKFGNLIPVQCDVTDQKSIENLANVVRKDHGYLNILVNNSGVPGPSSKIPEKHDDIKEIQKAMLDQSMDEWLKTFQMNVAVHYFVSMTMLDLLDAGNKKSKVPYQSQVITTGSISGYLRTSFKEPCYNATKAAVNHLMKNLSTLFLDYGIRFNIIAPGVFATEMTAGPSDEKNKNTSFPMDKSQVPAGRPGAEEEMAATVLYLAGKGGAYCNGSLVVTDGGRLSSQPSSY